MGLICRTAGYKQVFRFQLRGILLDDRFFPSAGNTLSNYEICNDAKIIIMPLLRARR